MIAQIKTIGDIIMKRTTFIIIISLLIPFFGMSQTKTTIVDDLYYNPAAVNSQQTVQSQKTQQKRNSKTGVNYKNGAKEIVYVERENPNLKVIHDTVYVVGQANDNRIYNNNKDGHDTVFVVGQANDSTEYNQEHGHYLNGFNGSESDLEYAERIRRFHNPKYEFSIGDPRYYEISFLNNNDWNVYVDDSYAYVTPTWTNPYWWNYYYSPFSYGDWNFRYNNYYSPWGFDNFYGGFGYGSYGFGGFGYGGFGYGGFGYGGFGDYYGYGYGGYGGYGYGGYGYGYGGYGYGGYGYSSWGGRNPNTNPNYNEANRRSTSNNNGTDRLGGTRTAASGTIGGGNYSNPSGSRYTTISGSRNNPSTVNSTRSTVNSRQSVNSNGIGNVRTTGTRAQFNNPNFTGVNTLSRSGNNIINTRPRTYTTTISNAPDGNSTSRSVNTNNSATRSNSYSTGNTSRISSGASTQSSSGSNRSSSPTYSSGSSSYSSGNSGGRSSVSSSSSSRE